MKPYYRYAKEVTEGKIVCGESIRLACSRFLNDLNRPELEFREAVVDRAIAFIGTLKHFAGKSSGRNFILEDWQ